MNQSPGKAHFIGVAGVGMAATAKLLADNGWHISGSDEGFYPPMEDYIKTLPFDLREGYRKENIPNDVDLIVIGKTGSLNRETNEEVQAAYESGVSIQSFPEVLHELTKDRHTLVIAGSYGKSTVSALLSWSLLHANKKPGYLIGAWPIGMKHTSDLGESDIFVIEGDEYPTSHTDITSKFMYYNPTDVLLTSADHDHLDQFPTHEDFLNRFRGLLDIIPNNGLLVACTDNEHVRKLVSDYDKTIVTYGLDASNDPKWSGDDFTFGEKSSFVLTKNGKPVVKIETDLLGRHNIQNIVGAGALLLERDLISPEAFASAMKAFRGIARRLDKKTKVSEIPVYEGFGSSYQKARAATEAIKLHFPKKRLVTIFEPHTFSWRKRESLPWYRDAFSGSDHLILYREEEHRGLSGEEISQHEMEQEIKKGGIDVMPTTDPDETIEHLSKTLGEDDVVLILSSGGMSGLIERVVQLAEKQFPKKIAL